MKSIDIKKFRLSFRFKLNFVEGFYLRERPQGEIEYFPQQIWFPNEKWTTIIDRNFVDNIISLADSWAINIKNILT